MTWEQIFLGCFAFGFVLSLIAFVAGSTHLHFHMHHGGSVAHAHGASGAHHGSGVSKFNFGTVAAFLTWFGGTGYILSSWGRIGIALILIVAVAIGLVGAPSLWSTCHGRPPCWPRARAASSATRTTGAWSPCSTPGWPPPRTGVSCWRPCPPCGVPWTSMRWSRSCGARSRTRPRRRRTRRVRRPGAGADAPTPVPRDARVSSRGG